MKNCTLITCSYNTPSVTITMLRSFVLMNGCGPHNLILMENSTDEDTVNRLLKHNVPYIRNKGMTHAEAVDKAIHMCSTKYALLVDSDIIFNRPINDAFFDNIANNDATLVGKATSSRAGYKLKSRIDPWFCFINIEDVQRFNIRFYDKNDPRILDTNSTGFYGNVPINNNKNSDVEMYDVGGTFYEDIKKSNLNIFNLIGIENSFKHYEGMSWYKNVGDDEHDNRARNRVEKYKKEISRFRKVELDGAFELNVK